jgi:DNA polymerase-4
LIVGGAGDRGVVAAASYEARAYGIHSAMASARARRLCPHAVFLPGRHARYGEVSGRVMDIFRSYTPLVEPISLDEAFLDVGGAARLHGSAPEIAAELRRRVHAEEGITCSVGVAPNKFVAKLASEAAKPRPSPQGPLPGLGVKVVTQAEVLAFLHPLPVSALWGVGPATLGRLQGLGVMSVGDLAGLDVATVTASLGTAAGRHLHDLANGIDGRAVEPDRRPKSIGHEETFAHDHHRVETLTRELIRLCDSVGTRLRDHSLAGRTVTLKVRFGDFHTITRSTTLGAATDSTQVVTREAKALLALVDPTPGVRLIGVSVSGLSEGGARQLSLDEIDGQPWDDATEAVDAIRARFGPRAIGPAALVRPDGRPAPAPGDRPWGPGQDSEPGPDSR